MQSERKKWNARYQDSQDDRPEPDPYLIESYTKFVSPLFPRPGRALDLAGGVGRHAIWLARQDWNTTLLDISPVALDAARNWSSGEHLRLEFVQADLDDYPLPEDAFAGCLTGQRCIRSLAWRSGYEMVRSKCANRPRKADIWVTVGAVPGLHG